MADINNGKVLRFENGGRILLGDGDSVLLNIVAGSLRIRIPGREVLLHKDRGTLDQLNLIPGDERPCALEFDCYYTADQVSTGRLRQVLRQQVASGLVVPLRITVQVRDFLGATTCDQYVFARCFLAEGEEIDLEGVGGEEPFDRLRYRFTDYEPAPAESRATIT